MSRKISPAVAASRQDDKDDPASALDYFLLGLFRVLGFRVLGFRDLGF